MIDSVPHVLTKLSKRMLFIAREVHRNSIETILKKSVTDNDNSKFRHNGGAISDEKIFANKFDMFFVNVGEPLANEISSTNRCPSEYIRSEIFGNFFASAVTVEICNIIRNYKENTAGWGDLQPRIMRLIQNYIKSQLAHICNHSLYDRHIPSELKVVNVVPIFKCFCVTWTVKTFGKSYV